MVDKQDWFVKNFSLSESSQAKEKRSMQFLNGIIWTLGMGLDSYRRLLKQKPYYILPATYALYRLSGIIVRNAYHLKFLYWLEPEVFTYRVLRWSYRFGYGEHFWTVFAFLATLLISFLGIDAVWKRRKYQRIFETVGLTNHLKESPALAYREKLPHKQERLILDSKGVGLSEFVAAKDRLASAFNQSVVSIELGQSPRFVAIKLSKARLRNFITFTEIAKEEPLLSDSFYIGMSASGPRQIAIAELPHLLAAGTTGAGKSVFFKQVVLGLLKSSDHIQMYLIDLKGGLEMVDFKDAPNVRVIKSVAEAVAVLRKIKSEMRSRFSFLEKNGLKEINPRRDKKDRIVVAVDEASVLYMNRSKNDREALLAAQAREVTDDIAKLSRAAATHLILATQKVSKETIETHVQENVSARMAFKMNTVPGSVIVLGTNEATLLPDTKGRGIWSFGSEKVIVQVPYASESYIKNQCHLIAEEIKDGRRRLFNLMIDVTKVSEPSPSSLPTELRGETEIDSGAQTRADGPKSEDSVSQIAWYLYENKSATVDQVRRDLFPLLTRRAVAKKLSGASKSGVIESANYPEVPRQHVFRVTPNGFREFVAPRGSHLRQELKSDAILHDLALVDIRHHLEADPRVRSFQTENIVCSTTHSPESDHLVLLEGINPDGIFRLESNGKSSTVALEYEASKKTVERYRDLLEAYYSRPGITAVFFVCKDEKLASYIRDVEASLDRSERAKIFYSIYDQWVPSSNVSFTNLARESIRIIPVPQVPSQFHLEQAPNFEKEPKC